MCKSQGEDELCRRAGQIQQHKDASVELLSIQLLLAAKQRILIPVAEQSHSMV